MSFSVKELDENLAKKFDEAYGVKNAFVEFNPGKCLLPPHHALIAQDIIDFDVRSDDVWLISYPRTGSTWCQEIIWLLGNNLDFITAQNTIQQLRAPVIEMSTLLFEYHQALGKAVENSVEYVKNLPSPRFIKSHLPIGLLPKKLDKIKPKTIYICRNPKDMCVSLYFHMKLLHNLNMDFNDFCDLVLNDEPPLTPVFQHYLDYWNKKNEPNILFIWYEELKSDTKNTIKKIAKFLEKNYSDDDIDKLTNFLNFSNMRKNKGCNFQVLVDSKNGENFYEKTQKHFLRKGVIGDWKNHMSPELEKRFDEWIAKNLNGTDLEFFM